MIALMSTASVELHTIDRTVPRTGTTVTNPISVDRAALRVHRHASQYSHMSARTMAENVHARESADRADFALSEEADLVRVELLPRVVLDQPDAREHLG